MTNVSGWMSLLFLLVGCAHAPRSLGTVEATHVFTHGTLKIEQVVFAGPEQRGLVRFSGSDTAFDGHVFATTSSSGTQWTSHTIRWGGRTWQVLLQTNNALYAFTPAAQDVVLTRDVSASAALDPAGLVASHLEETERGVLAKLSEFDRPGTIASEQGKLEAAAAVARTACEADLKLAVDWAKATDAWLLDSVGPGACGEVLRGVTILCGNKTAREFVREHLKRFQCVPGDEVHPPESKPSTWTLEGEELRFTVNHSVNIEERTRGFLEQHGRTATGAPFPWRDGASLGDQIVLDAMSVCSDGRGHLVVAGPRSKEARLEKEPPPTLHVGTAADGLMPVALDMERTDRWLTSTSGLWFVDGRQRSRQAETKFLSRVLADAEKRECTVLCGEREVRVPMLPAAEGRALLLAAKVARQPFTRKPYALLRDGAGNYYFVDTGSQAERAKDFRVFKGARGQLQQLKMTNSLSDSEGDLFTTKGGELRLVLDREKPSFWTAGGKRVELRAVPVSENLDVIFAELGVYAGQRLGTPCDDF